MFIHERFLAMADRVPDQQALVWRGESLTYRDCAARVERLAAGLAARLPVGGRVVLHMYKSPDAILMMLACLRAGLAYVPIDPAAPGERRQYVLRDSGARGLILDARTARQWQAEQHLLSSLDLLVQLDSPVPLERAVTAQDLASAGRGQPDAPQSPHDLAYILYTSGSTGTPKGVMISHANAAAFVDWASASFDLDRSDHVALHAPLHFDLPVFDIYVTLGRGATLYPIDEQTALFPEALRRFILQHSITVLYAVPSALAALVHRSALTAGGLPDVRLLLYAGEEFYPPALARLMDALPNARVFNLYGPIETNVVTSFPVQRSDLSAAHISIGRPVVNTALFLTDEAGQVITETGRAGEIAVSGPSVSPGYLNRPDLTEATRALLHRWGRGWPCYRTGDFARWDTEGMLHFLGRRDAMIKTRGFRVELGDVEAAIMRHPDVVEAAVVAVPHPEHTNLLSAFVVPRASSAPSSADLLSWCRERLPLYMVPQTVTFCPELPRTSTGKVARNRLPTDVTPTHPSW